MSATASPTLCVFAGSRPGARPAYVTASEQLAEALHRNGVHLVYGGGSRGLMGTLSSRALALGVPVTGVVPRGLFDLEAPRSDLESFIVTDSMHERKQAMYARADGFVLLPGGTGSLDEFFEVLTWNHIGNHNKRIAVVNTEGYYGPLEALVAQIEREGFSGTLRDARLSFTADIDRAVSFAIAQP